MAEIETKNGNFHHGISEFFKKLLSDNIVEAVLVPQEINGNVVQTLICEPENVGKVDPLTPILRANSARTISRLTIKDSDQRIAALLRPCEVRALIELAKLKQANIDNLFIIGIDCFGTYSVSDYAAKNEEFEGVEAATADFTEKVKANQEIPELRVACQLCQHFVPAFADIAINLIGTDWDQKLVICSGSDKGKKLLEELELEDTSESEERKLAIEKEKERRGKRREEIEKEDMDFLQLISLRCINCQNCRAVCPICYCRQCVFEGTTFEYSKEKYLSWAKRKGVLEMPADVALFHLTRMSHVLASCVACGQCEAACPSQIPLGRIYHRLSSEVQKLFDYEAGRELDEELPLSVFREDELQTVES